MSHIEMIEKAKQQKTNALLASDSELFSLCYDEKGEILASGGAVVHGRKEIKEQIESFMTLLGSVRLELQTDDIWPHGDIIYEKGRFSYSYADGAEFYKGNYVCLWKDQKDGSVKVYREIEIE